MWTNVHVCTHRCFQDCFCPGFQYQWTDRATVSLKQTTDLRKITLLTVTELHCFYLVKTVFGKPSMPGEMQCMPLQPLGAKAQETRPAESSERGLCPRTQGYLESWFEQRSPPENRTGKAAGNALILILNEHWSHRKSWCSHCCKLVISTASGPSEMTAHTGGKNCMSSSLNSLTFTLGSNAVHAESSDTCGTAQVKPAVKWQVSGH